MPTTPKTETRSFKMHEKLLYDVIQRQAGTLEKALVWHSGGSPHELLSALVKEGVCTS